MQTELWSADSRSRCNAGENSPIRSKETRLESEGSATLLQPSRTFLHHLHHGAAEHGGDGGPVIKTK